MTILDHSNNRLKLVVATPLVLATFWFGLNQNQKPALDVTEVRAPIQMHTTSFDQSHTKVTEEIVALPKAKVLDSRTNIRSHDQKESHNKIQQESVLLKSTQPLVTVRRGPALENPNAHQPKTGRYNNASFVPSPRDVSSGLVATIDQTTGQIRYGHHPGSLAGASAE